MKCLSIDTVTASCSVALSDGSQTIQRKEMQPGGHSRMVLDMADRVLVDGGLSLGQLDAIVVDTGPGSFTGVRIGLGVAQGLAYGAGLPVIGVCSLEVIAISVGSGIVASAIDARMKQVYCAVYEVHESSRPVPLMAPCVCFPEQFISAGLGQAQYGVGNGWDIYADTLAGQPRSQPVQIEDVLFPEADQGISLAQRIGLEGAVDPRWLEATYIRNQVTG